jgi:hypothetical protein
LSANGILAHETPPARMVTVRQVSATVVAPVILLLVILAVDLWIYKDARAHCDSGRPVVVTIGSITIDTPATWLGGCLVLSIVFIPLYFVAREAA